MNNIFENHITFLKSSLNIYYTSDSGFGTLYGVHAHPMSLKTCPSLILFVKKKYGYNTAIKEEMQAI